MLFSKCLRAKIYCNMNGHFDPQGCQTLLLKESELFLLSLGSWTIKKLYGQSSLSAQLICQLNTGESTPFMKMKLFKEKIH